MAGLSVAADAVQEIKLSTDAYSLDTIKKAAYRLIDRMSVNIRVDGSLVVCQLLLKEAEPNDTQRTLEQTFLDEVLDQDLRESVARETEAVRNAVLAYAFSRTGMQGE